MEEQVWLDRHQDIVLGTTLEYPPMVIANSDGSHVGVLVDLFAQINKLLNTQIRLYIDNSWFNAQKKAEQKKIDGLAMGGRTPNRAKFYNSTNVIMPTFYSIFARASNEYQFTQFSDLKGMRVGYINGANSVKSLLETNSEITILPYDNYESITQALLSKEIDVIVAWMSYDFWRKKKLQGMIENVFFITEYPIEMVTHIRKDWPELIPILNKAIASIQKNKMPWITNKWFGRWPQKLDVTSVHLTSDEQAWLEKKHTVRVRVGDNPPWNINTPAPQGMTVDYLKIIGERFGINFKFISSTPMHKYA